MNYAPHPESAPYGYAPIRTSNTLGVVGFVCALLGLLSGGHLLSPIGLILSLVALGNRPRGFAIWGVILGFLGTCGWMLVVGLLILAAAGMAVAGAGVFFFSQADRIELTTDMAKIAMKAEDYKRENRGIPPADLAVLGLQSATLMDPWGHNYHYELVEGDPGFDIISDGPDGKAGTEDDVRLNNLEKYWEGAGEDFAQQLREFEKRQNQPHKTKVSIGPHASVTVGKGGVTIEAGGDDDGDGATTTMPATQPQTP